MKKFKIINDEDKSKVINYLNAVNIEKPLEVSIKPYKPNRSAAQNRLYWKWLKIIGDDLGYVDSEMHALMVDQFLGYTETKCMERVITQLVSTASLKVKPMAEYLTRIEVFAASELGIVLPNKDDEYFESMGYKRS